MADVKSRIQDLIDKVKNARGDYDTRWLGWYLNSLSGDEQMAAVQTVQDAVNNDDFGGGVGELNTRAHYAADQQSYQTKVGKDPVLTLEGKGSISLFHPNEDHTPWSKQQLDDLRSYFKSDPVLKNNVKAQVAIVNQLAKTGVAGSGDPVQQAKKINWSNMTLEQRAKYGYQSGDLRSIDDLFKVGGLSADAGTTGDVNLSGLKAYVDKLKGADKYVALQTLNQQLKGHMYLEQKDIDHALSSLQQQAQQKKAATQKATQAQQPQAATGALPFGVPAEADSKWNPSKEQVDLIKQVTGQDFEAGYQAFIKQYAIAVQQRDQSTGLMLDDKQIWTSGKYEPTTGQWVPTKVARNDPSVQGKKGDTTPTRAQYLGMVSTSQLKLATQVEGLARQYWTQNYGTEFPKELNQAIYAKIGAMSTQQIYDMVQSSGGSSSSPLAYLVTGGKSATGQWSGTGAIDQVIESYVSSHPEVTQESTQQAAANAFVTSYTQSLGHPPSADEIKRAAGADSVTQQRIIDNTKMGNGLTYGTYSNRMSALQGQWRQYFGRDPTDKEIAWSVGRSSADIQDFINQSPSHVSGLNVGQYEGYRSVLDQVGGELWGSGSNDAMIQAVHTNTAGKK